jgi:hypothetical protein
MAINTLHTHWTDDEQIVDTVRKMRNDLIKDFLDERHLKEYVADHFRIRELSRIAIEGIRKDLKELLTAPVNTTHYEPVITHLRQTESVTLSASEEQLFQRELDTIIKHYMYE